MLKGTKGIKGKKTTPDEELLKSVRTLGRCFQDVRDSLFLLTQRMDSLEKKFDEKPKEESKEEPEAKPKEEPKEEPEAKPKEEPEAKPKEEPEAKPKEEPEAKPETKPRVARVYSYMAPEGVVAYTPDIWKAVQASDNHCSVAYVWVKDEEIIRPLTPEEAHALLP